MRKHKASFFVALIAIPIAALIIDTLLPYFLAQAIGQLSSGDHEALVEGLLIAGGVGLFGAIINTIGFQALMRQEAEVRADLSSETFKQLINKDLRFFVNSKVGALTSRYIDFLRSQVTILGLLVMRTLGFILSVGVGLVLLFTASWVVAVIVMLFIITLIVQVRWGIRVRTPWRTARKETTGKIYGQVADSITNSLVVKTFAAEDRELSKVIDLNNQFRRAFRKDVGFAMYEGSARQALMIFIQIVSVSVAAYLVFSGQLAVAIAIFVLAYMQQLGSQIFKLGDMLNGYEQALIEAAPMTEMLDKPLTVADVPEAAELAIINPSIRLENVSFVYDDGVEKVLDDININIPAGQKIGIVGHSGSGKTTITHLLLRFVDVTGGAIFIDGQDIRQVTQTSLRENIAYVPQEPMLFHRSLRENIAYGKTDAREEDIRLAASQASAIEFIDKLPKGLDTLVGERGVKLSGGQRQRVAIARAILKDAPILVLDEATSALDSESEKLIQQSLSGLMAGRTSIVIAHRLSTIAKLDRIVVISEGKIIEDGSHSELLAHKGVYARLWEHQSGGFIQT